VRYLRTVELPIDGLQPYPGNARTHDESALDESAETNGQYRSVVARDMGDGEPPQVLAGHGTWGAFRRRGDKTLRVEIIEADPTEARRIVLADNGTSRNAGYDEKLLDSASKDGGLGGTGWDADAYKELLDAADESENPFDYDGEGDPDDVDVEPPAEATTQPGDVWVLGPHRLVCGDSTDAAAWGTLLRGERLDLLWTDPPYGVAYEGKTKDALTIQNDDLDEGDQLQAFLRDSLSHALEACKPGACWYVAAPSGRQFLDFGVVLRDFDVWRQTLVWVKDTFALGRSDYHYRHESIFYGWKPGAAHQAVPDRTQDTVWEFPKPSRNAEHPTMKPVALVQRALENSSDRGHLVGDAFGGSGTTLIAAHVSGRVARLLELDGRYCDVIARRYQELTGDLPVLERTGKRWDFTGADGSVAVAA
jgi:DNA modification methylase